MPSQIQLRYPGMEGDPDGSLGIRVENTVNAPVDSISDLDNGQAIAGEYELVFTNTAGTITVDVTAADGSKNPWDADDVAVVADSVTENNEIVPGVGIVVNSSVDTGWTAVITIGAYMSSGAVVTDILNTGIVTAGSNSTQQRIAAVNIGDEDSANSGVVALPGVWFEPKSSNAFVECIDNHTDDTREHLAIEGDYTITFTNWQDGTGDDAGYKTCDIVVDGVTAVVTARFDGDTKYQYGVTQYVDGADKLRGLYIILALTTSDPTSVTVTLHVMAGDDWVELAPDNAGSPGSWQDGTTELTLTESGQATGTITQSNEAYFWYRWNLPDDAEPDDIRVFNLRCKGLSI